MYLVIVTMIIIANSAHAQTFVMQGVATPTATLVSNDPNDTICVGSGVIFTATIQGTSTYRFYVNGTSVQGPASANTYTPSPFSAGNQQVVVLVDNGTCSAKDTVNFVTLALPTATLNVTPNDTICLGTPVTFTAPTGGTNYTFKVNGTSMQSSTSNTYITSTLANHDSVTVTLTNSNGCINTSSKMPIIVNSLPTATLNVSPNDTICFGTSVTFTAPTGGTTYTFRKNGISVQSGAGNTFVTTTLANHDSISVTVTNSSGCTNTSSKMPIIVNPLPTITSVTGNLTAGCVGTNGSVAIVGLTGTSPWSFEIWTNVGGNPGSLYYTVPGTFSNPSPTLSVPIPAVGNTTLQIRYIDAHGCKNF